MGSKGTKDFIHLHVHTQFSLLDGATKISRIFGRCEKLAQSAVAITDHGNMYGALEFCKAAVKHTDPSAEFYDFMKKRKPFKVKPIIGCEVYVTDDMNVRESDGGRMPKLNHLVLLAKNETGYHNLIKMVSFSFMHGMYYKPRIDMKLLEEYHEGLICLSACLAGALPQALLAGDFKKADQIAKEFKTLFGDDYYIELQDHNIKNQKAILPHLIRIARENNIKLVCTNDVHYLTQEDWAMQKVLQCISFRRTVSAEELERPEDDSIAEFGSDGDGYFPTREFYLKSRAEMEKMFPSLADALDNTLEIAEKCDCYYFEKEQLYPAYTSENKAEQRAAENGIVAEKVKNAKATGIAQKSKTQSEKSKKHEEEKRTAVVAAFLREKTYEGLKQKYKAVTKEMWERADFELNIIESMGFIDYFLIVWDFIHFAESQGIPVGPGRGSGVGSIVAYSLGITKVDPLKYGLLFERFLNPERVSSPDFDIDFCVDRRDEVIRYVVDKYGADNVSQIVTFGTLAAKAAVKDVGRVYNYPYAEVERITKLIPFAMGKHKLADVVGQTGVDAVVPDLKELYKTDPMAKSIIDMAIQIEGMPRQTGMHAAGVIICKDPIYEHVPMAKTSDGFVTTEFNMVECEELGLLKMDFLGLRTLTDIKKALDIILETRGEKIDFYNMEYDNAGVFELISEGDTHAVFQLESEGMKRFMRDLKPTVFEDIIAGVALYRPGPMDNIPSYVRGKKNAAKIRYDHPVLEPILNVTYGIMVYQEQVMQAVQALAGYTLGRADELRRMISKKKMKAMDAERQVFLYGYDQEKFEATAKLRGAAEATAAGEPTEVKEDPMPKVKEDLSAGAAAEGQEQKAKIKIPGAIANGVDEKTANKIFDDIIKFADYAFNKSHATAYAYLSYQTAYLKKYYTVEFITAVLNNRITSIDEITNYLNYLKGKNIPVFPPDINRSRAGFSVENGSVRIGMAAIKNVGAGVVGEIVAEREQNGAFKDFEDFVSRMMRSTTLNKRMLESLILSGTFDCFLNPRAQLMQVYEGVMSRAIKDREASLSGQFSFFDEKNGMLGGQKTAYTKVKEFDLADKLRYEKQVAGVYLTGHPLEEYADFLRSFTYNSSHFAANKTIAEDESLHTADTVENGDTLPILSDGMNITLGGMLVEATKRFTKQGKELGVGKLEDLNGMVEVLVSGHVLNKSRALFQADKLVTISGKIKMRDDGITLWVDAITEFHHGAKSAATRKICFYLDITDVKQVDELREILRAYPGADESFIKSTHDSKLYPLETGVSINDTLLAEITGLVGKENIKLA